jgi:ribosome recycling factor
MKTEQQAAAPSGQVFNSLKEVEANLKARMDKAVSDLQHEMASIRTGRASLGILDHIRVDYYGTPTPLHQVGNISVPDARMLVVQPWDKSMLGPIEKAIQKADLGLNPVNDGSVIRLPVPQLTEERRKDLVKVVKKEGEEKKVMIRNLRRDANDKVKVLEKDAKISEDEGKKGLDDIQKLTDRYIHEIDKLLEQKEKEIMEV